MPVTTFTAMQVRGPQGEKMVRVNGVDYPLKEGMKVIEDLTESLLSGLSELEEFDCCSHCGVLPCIIYGGQAQDIGVMAINMSEKGTPNSYIQWACYRAFDNLLEERLGEKSYKGVPKCVASILAKHYPVTVPQETSS